jgi:hypothetical protein
LARSKYPYGAQAILTGKPVIIVSQALSGAARPSTAKEATTVATGRSSSAENRLGTGAHAPILVITYHRTEMPELRAEGRGGRGQRRQRAESRGQRAESDRGQKADDREQRADNRRQGAEDRGQKAEGRG